MKGRLSLLADYAQHTLNGFDYYADNKYSSANVLISIEIYCHADNGKENERNIKDVSYKKETSFFGIAHLFQRATLVWVFILRFFWHGDTKSWEVDILFHCFLKFRKQLSHTVNRGPTKFRISLFELRAIRGEHVFVGDYLVGCHMGDSLTYCIIVSKPFY